VKAIAQTLQKVAMKGGLCTCQVIVNPKPALSCFHQSRSPQVAQMTRSGRLRDPQNLYQVPNAHLTARQKTKDSEPGPVRKCPENQIDLCFALLHYIRPRESTTRKRMTQDLKYRRQINRSLTAADCPVLSRDQLGLWHRRLIRQWKILLAA
jgi:hypothetical protein